MLSTSLPGLRKDKELLSKLDQKQKLVTARPGAVQFYGSNGGAAWKVFQILLGVISYCVVVFGLHLTDITSERGVNAVVEKIQLFEYILGGLMLTDHLVRLVWRIPTSILFRVVDFVILAPSFAFGGKTFVVLCTARLWRLLQLQEASMFILARGQKRFSATNSVRQHQQLLTQFLYLSSVIVVLVFCSASIFNVLEPDCFPSWFEGLFFTIVTISTVGYGDSYPVTTTGRQFAMFEITFAFLAVPFLVTSLFQTYGRLKKSMVGRMLPSMTTKPFVLVVGRFDLVEVAAIVEEFFPLENRALIKRRFGTVPNICFVQDTVPSKDLKNYLSQPMWRDRLTYHRADASKLEELQALDLSNAVGCLIMTSKTANKRADMRSVMYALAMSQLGGAVASSLQMEVHQQSHQDIAHVVGVNNCVCLEKFRGLLLGNGLRCRGLTTLVFNLLKSHMSPELYPKSELEDWTEEYLFGMSMDIYEVALLAYSGRTFASAALTMYQKFGVTLFAVHVPCDETRMLNPGHHHLISSSDRGYVIATDEDLARRAEKMMRIPKSRWRQNSRKPSFRQTRHHSDRFGQITTVELHSSFRVLPNQHVADALAESCSLSGEGTIAGLIANDHFHTLSFYETLKTKRTLSEALVKKGQVLQFQNHVIIVSGSLEDVFHSIIPLRRRILAEKEKRVVVLVVPQVPSEDDWTSKQFGLLSEVYIVVGRLTSPEVFAQAGVDHCHSVLVTNTPCTLLNQTNKPQQGEGCDQSPEMEETESWTHDSMALGISSLLANMLEKKDGVHRPRVCTEIVERSSLALMSLIVGESSRTFASGDVVSLDQLRGALSVQLLLKPFLFNMIHLLLFGQEISFREISGRNDSTQLRQVYVHERDLPFEAEGRTYNELFAWCANRGQICLALYRAKGTNQSETPYILTNPPPTTELVATDKVVALGFADVKPSSGGRLCSYVVDVSQHVVSSQPQV